MKHIGIIGASGYTGEELVALLAYHPQAMLTCLASRSLAGKTVGSYLPRLAPSPVGSLPFAPSDPEELAARDDVEIWFLALPHGVAAAYARTLIAAGKTVIDLSADFRLGDPHRYQHYYGAPHPDLELLRATPYVLPELALDDTWKQSPLIAVPGCYPTSIQIPLVPLLREQCISGHGIVINSYSAVSGAGRKLDNRYLFVDRAESLTPYGLASHRHLSEIEEQLSAAAGSAVTVQFTPHLAPLRRGILSTIVCPASVDADSVLKCWKDAYRDRPFINILQNGVLPDTANVAGTNRVDIAVLKDPRTGNLILTSAIDNLIKGAGGQAIQILNLLQGWNETEGLPLS